MKSSVALNHGELLWITRRREGLDQVEMAEKMGVSRHKYQESEAQKTGKLYRRLEDHERCALYRRRTKKTQSAIAKEIGVSRIWVNRMEIGTAEVDKLLAYWRGLGYR